MIITVYAMVLMLYVITDLTISLLEGDNEAFSKTAILALLYSPMVAMALGWI